MSREPKGKKENKSFNVLSAMICASGLEQLKKEVENGKTGCLADGVWLESKDVIELLQSGIDLFNKIKSGSVFIFSDREALK